MKVCFRTLYACPDGIFLPGQTAEVDEKTGERLTAGGYASAEGEPVKAAPAKNKRTGRKSPKRG